MCGAVAEMKRQYGNLSCAQSVGLRVQLFASCVQPVGSFASEVWGVLPCTGPTKNQRAALVNTHLEMLKELAGLCKTTPTDIVYAELHECPLIMSGCLERQGCGMFFMQGLNFMPMCSKMLLLSQGLGAGTG